MRRRALMAASQTGGGGEIDTWLQFPLYLHFDYCEDRILSYYCYGSGDYAELHRVLRLVIEMYGEDDGIVALVDKAKLDELGIIIYVENEKIWQLTL